MTNLRVFAILNQTAADSGIPPTSHALQDVVFEAFFEVFASLSETAHLVQMFDSTVIRAQVSAAGAGGKKVK
ncbi:MAG: hypothetical protein ACREDT_01810, partial [Methylocella sp.]